MANVADEKGEYGIDRIESASSGREKSPDPNWQDEFSPAEQRKIIHRIDRRLVITLGVMYCVSLMVSKAMGR